ncbi:16S rRNA (cytidine(1402)-2'-O)-methyltransferase [Candidatus Pelagibacter sp.]|nr:16S rRNA (cytidine(1402)-2'-O)-methyltransferase [Candidatus Pelagibacter sp.]
MALKEDKNKIKNGLYLVSTPIGNLKDITLRALDVLSQSNLILCEDTRVSKKLLTYYKINTEILSYHKFNEKKNLEKIVNYLKENQIISLISDAGTPTISDPGRILVKRCVQENINIIPIPGASAITASISISGFSDKFYFHGFLSDTNNSIIKEFKFFKDLKCSIIFFISAKKLIKQFELLKNFFFDREILICRELTKLHESFYRGKISEVDKLLFNPKGEVTVIISEKSNNGEKDLSESDKKKIRKLIYSKSVKDIVRMIAQEKNISKSKIYNYCLQIKNEN